MGRGWRLGQPPARGTHAIGREDGEIAGMVSVRAMETIPATSPKKRVMGREIQPPFDARIRGSTSRLVERRARELGRSFDSHRRFESAIAWRGGFLLEQKWNQMG